MQKKKPKDARKHLISSQKRYTWAIKLGKQAFDKEIKKAMKEQKIPRKNARILVFKKFRPAAKEMDSWRNILDKIHKLLHK